MNFNNLIADLNKSMISDYCCVNEEINPFAKNIESHSKEDLINVLTQYSFFSKRIVSLFISAFYLFNYHKWDSISEELIQNISEELSLGGEHQNQPTSPHYVLLVNGFKKSFDIDLLSANQTIETENFLNSIGKLMSHVEPSYVAGCVYALESSAVPELNMVYKFVEKIYNEDNKNIDDSVKLFFESHINSIEIEHENRLKEQCSKYIKNHHEIENFSNGFKDLLTIMDVWWITMQQRIKTEIS
jgi:hypothetical protein